MSDDRVVAKVELKDDGLIQKFQDVVEHMKSKTNNRKEGKASALRLCIRRAWSSIERDEQLLEQIRSSIDWSIHGER